MYILCATLARLSHEGSLKCDHWALSQLRDYCGGKLIMWSWVSRGLAKLEEIAAWHFNNDIEATKNAMAYVRGGMSKLYSLDNVPDDPQPISDSVSAEADDKPLQGESLTFWAISDPDAADAAPIPLPQWFQLPIDTILLTWKKENEIWNKRIEKRQEQGKSELAPKAKESYQEWLKASERVLVLDKKKEAVVKNPEKKSQSTLKRTCLALVVHPAVDPSDLWIRAGTGKKWTLKLLRGQTAYGTDLPAEVDHFPGGGNVLALHAVYV